MKKVKHAIVAICFITMALLTNANNDKRPPLAAQKSETVQIQSYLDNLDYRKFIPASTDLQINFLVSDAKEIVVVSTNNLELDAFIKSNLNYKSLETNKLERNTTYTINVHIIVKD
jgi:hypothetical protein